jgi:hypothetical protein
LGEVKFGDWKYFEVADCMKCGGVGWHKIYRADGAESIVACDYCEAGKNMQVAPAPHISWTMAQCRGATYAGPGRKTSGPTHPEVIRRFGSLDELQKAINEGRVSTHGLKYEIVHGVGQSLGLEEEK